MMIADAWERDSDVPSPIVGIVTKRLQIERTAPESPRFSPPIARIVPPVRSTS
jgi:hypothetical protein